MTLKEARTLLGLTQRTLAERAKVNQQTIADIENGKNLRPAHETVTRIVRGLQLSGMVGVTAEQVFPVPDAQNEAAS